MLYFYIQKETLKKKVIILWHIFLYIFCKIQQKRIKTMNPSVTQDNPPL